MSLKRKQDKLIEAFAQGTLSIPAV